MIDADTFEQNQQDLESRNPVDAPTTVIFTRAQHAALSRIAKVRHTNIGALVREAVQVGMYKQYSEYSRIYQQALEQVASNQETEKKN